MCRYEWTGLYIYKNADVFINTCFYNDVILNYFSWPLSEHSPEDPSPGHLHMTDRQSSKGLMASSWNVHVYSSSGHRSELRCSVAKGERQSRVSKFLIWRLTKGNVFHTTITVKVLIKIPRGLSGLPWWLSWQRIHLQCRRPGLDPWKEDLLEKEMATHSNIFAWEITLTEEPVRLFNCEGLFHTLICMSLSFLF